MVKCSKQGVSKRVNNTVFSKGKSVNSTSVHKNRTRVSVQGNQNAFQNKRVIHKMNTDHSVEVKNKVAVNSVLNYLYIINLKLCVI